ncbi:MAG: hypothetical protein JXB88_26650 [Spirochaetales bacterium]|nr:hypothetical protein [Spirochaetales bacterium]
MQSMDFHQLFTIIKFGFIQEIRYKHSHKGKNRSYRTFIYMLIVYIFSGLMMGSFCARIGDSFSAAFFSSALFMILIGNFILLEFPTLITGPEDFSFYSSLPVTSSTYFFAKVFTMLLFVCIFSLCYSISGAVFLFLYTGKFVVIILFLYSHFISGIITALFIINLYGLLLKLFPLESIRKFSVFLNFSLFFLFYSVYFLLFHFFRQDVQLFKIEIVPLFLFFPNTWGSSLFILDKGVLPGISSLLSLLAPFFLLYSSRQIISMDFAEKIAEQSVAGGKKKKEKKDRRLFLFGNTFEEKVIARLIKVNFKYDIQFKLSILTIIPLTILYFLIVLLIYRGSLENPFTPAGIAGFPRTLFLYAAVGFFPFYIKSALTYSQQADASWVFFTTPYNRVKLILATRKFVFVFFLLPYFSFFIILYIMMAGVIIPILMHFLVVGILSFIQMCIFLFFMAEIPFSKKPQRGRRLLHLAARMAISILLPVPLFLFVMFIYPHPFFFWILVACLFIIAVIVEIAGRKKARGRLNREEFLY